MTPMSDQEIYKLFDFHLTEGKRGQFLNGEHCELILSTLAEQRKEIEKLRTGQALTNESYGKVQSQLFKAEKEIEELKVAEAHWEKQWKIQCDLTGLAESRILEVRRETIERIEERLLSTESMIARIDILEFLLAMKIEVEQPPTKKDKEIEELRKQLIEQIEFIELFARHDIKHKDCSMGCFGELQMMAIKYIQSIQSPKQ